MKIRRSSQLITLTATELFKAYCEQRDLLLQERLEGALVEKGITYEKDSAFFKKIFDEVANLVIYKEVPEREAFDIVLNKVEQEEN